MVVFILSVLDRKYPFWANLVQKIKIVSLNWYLGLRLTLILRTESWCLFFPFSTRGIPFLGNLFQKIKIVEAEFTTYNPGHNISELYNILVEIQFTTSKRKLDI